MPELSFVFGPDDGFFFDSPKAWKFFNIPPSLRQLVSSGTGPAWRVAQPFCLALAPRVNAAEGVWYLGCKVVAGEEKILYSHSSFDTIYPDLSRWTKAVPSAARQCYITFGPGYSYFASAPGRGSVWAGVPSELSDRVQKAGDTPCCVGLGVGGAWFVMWPGGQYYWNFYGGYPGLEGILREAGPGNVSYLAISPYNKQHYFVAFRNRSVRYDFTGAPPEWMGLMNEVFGQWEAERAQAQSAIAQQIVPPRNAVYNPNIAVPMQAPQVCAYYAPVPEPMAVELPGSLPEGVVMEPVPPPDASVKRKKFFSRIFD